MTNYLYAPKTLRERFNIKYSSNLTLPGQISAATLNTNSFLYLLTAPGYPYNSWCGNIADFYFATDLTVETAVDARNLMFGELK